MTEYLVVPELLEDSCWGCAVTGDCERQCVHGSDEFSVDIVIEDTPEARAEYAVLIAKKKMGVG